MATQYDPGIIAEFADRLYAQARSIIVTSTLLGALIGVFPGAAMALSSHDSTPGFLMALLGALILGPLGFAIGRARAFSLRLQAQTALCQAQIEVNTRR